MAVLQLLSIGESLLLDFGVGLLLIHNRDCYYNRGFWGMPRL
jgi:hypothetical protein